MWKMSFNTCLKYKKNIFIVVLIFCSIAFLITSGIGYFFKTVVGELSKENVRLLNSIYRLIHDLTLSCVTLTITHMLKNEKINSIKESLKYTWTNLDRWGAGIWYSGWRTFIFYLLLIIPGIYRQIQYSLFVYAIVDKDIDGEDACEYSKSVIKKSWWNVFLIQIFSFICVLIIELIMLLILLSINSVIIE
ncbi:hypothetical protein AGMMS50267_18420 [Spirochaetia bacterium]|nr:hypothetical protein AGMMS50267_18420 [Spirochaetia bacterium]